jgi:IS5 family transposase
MRRKKEAVLCFESSDEGVPTVIRQYRARYRAISQVLDDNPQVLAAVHQDLAKLSQGGPKGRKGDYSSENILRALIVQHLEGLPFRETIIRIGSDPFLQDFLRMRKKAIMDFTFLDKCFLAIEPATWKRVNERLSRYGIAQEVVHTEVIRTDTTVVEANIHYPTDASLLWDTWRVASRLLKRARAIAPASCPHRFHDRKLKRLYLYVTRYMSSKSKARQREVKTAFRTLIERTGWIVAIAGEFCVGATSPGNDELAAVALELKAYLPAMEQAVAQTRRTQGNGEKVPAAERVFSLFEPHTELIKRGRREKPVEFGQGPPVPDDGAIHHGLRGLRVAASRLRLDRVGDPAARATIRHEARSRGGGQGFLSGEDEVRGVGQAGPNAGHSPADAGLHGQGDGRVAGVPGGDRGDYFRSETRLSADSLFLSWGWEFFVGGRSGRVLPQPDRAGRAPVRLATALGKSEVAS